MPTFPPKNFIPTDSTIPGITIYKPKIDENPTDAPIVEFKCPQCQATTAYSIADGGLKCAHCGYYEPPAQKAVGKHAEEFEFTVETMAAAAHGWGTARQVLHCQHHTATGTIDAYLPLLRLKPSPATSSGTRQPPPALPPALPN